MKILHSFVCCLVLIFFSSLALSEETQVNCEENAIELGIEGDEYDIFIADCEMSNTSEDIIEESISELSTIEE